MAGDVVATKSGLAKTGSARPFALNQLYFKYTRGRAEGDDTHAIQ